MDETGGVDETGSTTDTDDGVVPPKGGFVVGTTRIVLEDAGAWEHLTPEIRVALGLDEGDSRALMVKIWYPAAADADAESRRHYAYHTETNDFPFPGGPLLDLLRGAVTPSRSYQNAQPVAAGAPVLLYSHGYGLFVEENEPMFERFVESGYVVVSIGHTGEASMVTLDGDTTVVALDAMEVDLDRELAPDPEALLQPADIAELLAVPIGDPVDPSILERYHYTNAVVADGAQAHLDLWVRDTVFVVAELEALGAEGGQFEGVFDLSTIGALGFSFGGAAARRYCSIEPRCRAALNLDGDTYARLDERTTKPYLRMTGDFAGTWAEALREGIPEDFFAEYEAEYAVYKTGSVHASVAAADAELFEIELRDASHGDFVGGWFELHDFGAGTAARQSSIGSVVHAFFDAYVVEDETALEELCAGVGDDPALTSTFDNVCALGR
ncbi:MAG: hypothetical protein ACRBN8_30745 [Nannocystales bacterium]